MMSIMLIIYSLQLPTNQIICIQLCLKVTIIFIILFLNITLFLGLLSNKMPEKVFDLFDEMAVGPDAVTFTVLFNACAQFSDDRAKKVGMKLLNQMPKHFQTNDILLTSAIDMLMKFGDVTSAEHLFQMIKKKDIITYGAMIKGNFMLINY
jgi:hypothetical protein